MTHKAMLLFPFSTSPILLIILLFLTAPAALGQTSVQDRIAYIDNGDIYLMSPDGSGKTNITNSPQRSETGPVYWSPDAQKIAYIAFDASVENLYVMNADGSGVQLLVNNFGFLPSWSPDSTRLIYSTRTQSQIYSINADGSNLTQISNFMPVDAPFAGFNPSWSPDGSTILFVGEISQFSSFYYYLYLMDADGSNIRPLLPYNPPGFPPSSAGFDVGQGCDYEWSPDGSKIAFAASSRPGMYAVGADGSGLTQIFTGGVESTNWRIAWSSDSIRIAYSSQGIYVVNFDGSGRRRLTSNPWDSSPAWSPNGKSIAFARTLGDIDLGLEIYVMNADGSNQRQLTNNSVPDQYPNWKPTTVCDCATISPLPIQNVSSPWPYDLNGTNPNWNMTVEITATEGVALKDVKLGSRYMAKRISVPFYYLETSGFPSPTMKGHLKPDSGDLSMHSRLVDYSVTTDDEKLVVKATYAIDRIGQSCLRITQRYEFYKQGAGGGCEPSDTLPCSRWKPIVEYQFFGSHGEKFTSINIAQRQHLTIDNNSYNTVGLFKDCDIPGTCLPSAGTSVPGVWGFERKANPLFYEAYGSAISKGQKSWEWDNFHQTYLARVAEPGFSASLRSFLVGGGCEECVHSHWRWGWLIGLLKPNFGRGRILGIPNGSQQDVDFAVVRYQSGEEDPANVKDLVQTDQPVRTYNTAGRNPLQIFRGSAPEEVVFWYSGTNTQNTNEFFGHGGFFNPTLPNKRLYGNNGFSPTTQSTSEAAPGSSPKFAAVSSQDGISAIDSGQIYGAGSTSIVPFDASLGGSLPAGYTQYGSLSYDVTTTAESSGPYTSNFSVPSVVDQTVFSNLRIFHLEQDPYDPDAVIWVDRTVLPPDPAAPDFATNSLNARTDLLGQFVLASLSDPQPPNTGIADVALSFADSPDPIVAGNNLTYTLTIANNGPQTATGVNLVDPLPPTSDYVSVASTQGTCKQTEGSIVCKLGSVTAGTSATVTIVAKAGNGGFVLPAQGQIIHNIAHVVANEGDSDPANNTATADTTILPNPNLAPTVSIASPGNGGAFVGPAANIAVIANSADSDGSVSTVEFFDNGQSLGFGTLSGTNQYTFNWTNVSFGNHSLIAVATDNAGRDAFSDAANIFVNGTANVSILSPAERAEFTSPANVTLTASATPSGSSIGEVDFYADGVFVGAGNSIGSNQYGVTWNNVYSGSYLLTAAAIDNSGVVTQSNAVRIYVNLRVNNPPVATITVPANGATFTTPTSVTINANATDSDGSVTSVDFYADGAFIGSGAITAPNQYSFTWPNVPIGDHTLTTVATDNEGAITNSTSITIKVVSPALFVADSTTLNSSDAALKTRMEALNYTVTVTSAASSTTADATGKAVVVISSTVTPTSVGTKFRTVTVPVVTWESGLFANMGMTGSTNKDFGTITKQTQVKITNPAHPLAAGLSGTVGVVTTSGTLSWGKPNANAASVATAASDTTKTLIFGYATGAVMPGLTAPARRVGLFMYDTSAASFTTSGGALFDAAIKWATGRI